MKKIVFLVCMSLLFSMNMSAQGWLEKVGQKAVNTAKQKVENRASKKAGEATDKALDKLEKKDNKKVETDENKNEGTQTADKSVKEEKLTATSKYDFIPGEKVIFFDDFSQDAVGDFPALWNTNGSAEVVTTNLFPGNWMKFVMKECVWTDALLQLPDNYTIEFDVIPIGGLEGPGMSGWNMRLMQAKNAKAWDGGSAPGNGGIEFSIEYFGRPSYHTWLYGKECELAKLNGYKEGEEYKEKINQNIILQSGFRKREFVYIKIRINFLMLPKLSQLVV